MSSAAFAPAMIARKQGVIVNLSSWLGSRGVAAGVAPYCASKWAIEGLTKALAAELPAGMAAVPLNPGVIDTPMLRLTWGEEAAGQSETGGLGGDRRALHPPAGTEGQRLFAQCRRRVSVRRRPRSRPAANSA